MRITNPMSSKLITLLPSRRGSVIVRDLEAPMDRGRLRYALVELRVKIPVGVPYSGAASAVRAAVNADTERQTTVEQVLDHEELKTADVILFPGYTLVGRKLPPAISQRVRDRYVVLELMSADDAVDDPTPKRRWRRTFVLGPGGQLCGPVRQRVITSDDAWNNHGGASEETLRVVAELDGERAPRRTWSSRGRTETSLLVCGEVNIAYPQKDGTTWAADPRLLDSLAGCRVIANPAHTPSSLPAMQRKREWLSERRALLTTANVHDGYTQRKTPKNAAPYTIAAKGQLTGAEAYIDGERYNASQILGWHGASAISEPKYSIILFDL